MFTYVCLGNNDLARSVRFYDPVMAALGHQRCHTPGVVVEVFCVVEIGKWNYVHRRTIVPANEGVSPGL